MANLVEQLRAYGGYLDELSPPSPSSIRNDRSRSRRRMVFATLTAVLAAAIAAVLVAQDTDAPGRLTTNAPSEAVSTTSALATTSVTVLTAAEAAIVAEKPTLAQQIARLENWYKNAPADAPGGRPMLAAEYVFCDAAQMDPRDPARGTFASNFPLGQPLTEARIAEACAKSDSPTARKLDAMFKLCSTTMRGPRYDLAVTSIAPVTRPILVFGATSCATAGYSAADGLLDSLNALRNIEINLRAVPRDCPTEEETTAWVRKVSKDQLGQEWTIGSPASSSPPLNGCFRPHLIDRETGQVHCIVSPRS